MMSHLLLASSSTTRLRLLLNAGLAVESMPPRIEESAARAALAAEGATPRDVADALAEMKAQKVSSQHPEALVIGCDQVLDHRGAILSKPETRGEARGQLGRLNGDRHMLLSAVVVAEAGGAIWRHVGVARMQMRSCSDAWLDGYVERNWSEIRHSIGGYLIEAEGVRLFSRIEGDTFTILGLPLIELLSWLTARGTLPG
jgi:septum formation protein